MEKLVAMSKNSTATRMSREERNLRNPSAAQSAHVNASHGESSCAVPTGTNAREMLISVSDHPYAEVKILPENQKFAERGSSPPCDERHPTTSPRSNFFQRFTARVRRHASHPELDFSTDGCSADDLAKDDGSPRLRESKSMDDVLSSASDPHESFNAVVFVNSAVDPVCKLLSIDTEEKSKSKRNSVISVNSSRDHMNGSTSPDSGNYQSSEDDFRPELPERLYLDFNDQEQELEPEAEAEAEADDDNLFPPPLQAHQSPGDVVEVQREIPKEPSPAPLLRKSKLMQDMLALNKCGYYWGPIDEDAATRELADQPEGTFLIHDSQDVHHLYVVSVVLDHSVSHFLINSFDDQRGYTFNIPDQQAIHPTPDDIRWNTLQETVPRLMEWAQQLTAGSRHRRGVRPYLIKPLTHPYEVPTLQCLCRTYICKDMKVTRHQIRFLPLPRMVQDYLLQYGYFAA